MKELRTDYDVILLGCSCYAMGRAAGARNAQRVG